MVKLYKLVYYLRLVKLAKKPSKVRPYSIVLLTLISPRSEYTENICGCYFPFISIYRYLACLGCSDGYGLNSNFALVILMMRHKNHL